MVTDLRTPVLPRPEVGSGKNRAHVLKPSVIARRARRAVAIQLDCFVISQGGPPRNDSLKIR
jgi:hypothetical protein